MSIDTIERSDTDTATEPGTIDVVETTPEPSLHEPGDHERFTHAVKKDDWFRGVMLGEEITAMCGKTWRPNRDPDAFPICPVCKQWIEGARPGDEGEQGPVHRDLT